MTEAENELINCVHDNFDFEKVHKVMTCLDWHWKNGRVPDLSEIKQFARKLLKDAIERSPKTLATYDTACGGFHVAIYREASEETGMFAVVFVEINFQICSSEYDVQWVGEKE